MTLSRRDFVVAGLGLLATGCSSQMRMPISELPHAQWPTMPRSAGSGRYIPVRPAAARRPSANPPAAPWPDHHHGDGKTRLVLRSAWAKAGPIAARLNPMNGIKMITVHHEGWTPVFFAAADLTAQRLDLIRRSHIERMQAGDIGYHFIIDRTGLLWQGRDLRYQGAHVKEHNPHNLGIMVLGNFEQQQPTTAQLQALERVLPLFQSQFNVPSRYVYTHRELNPTDCPGKNLQSRTPAIRRGLG
jgi:hypothetical protein